MMEYCLAVVGDPADPSGSVETATQFQPWHVNSLNGNACVESEPAQ